MPIVERFAGPGSQVFLGISFILLKNAVLGLRSVFAALIWAEPPS